MNFNTTLLSSAYLALTVLAIAPSQLADLLPIKRISILISQELRPHFVFVKQLLISLQLLAGFVPGARSFDLIQIYIVNFVKYEKIQIYADMGSQCVTFFLIFQSYLKGVYIGRDWLDVVFLHQGPLVEPSKEPNLNLTITVLLGRNHLGRPVRETFLLGIHNVMERPAGLGKPVLVPPKVQKNLCKFFSYAKFYHSFNLFGNKVNYKKPFIRFCSRYLVGQLMTLLGGSYFKPQAIQY